MWVYFITILSVLCPNKYLLPKHEAGSKYLLGGSQIGATYPAKPILLQLDAVLIYPRRARMT